MSEDYKKIALEDVKKGQRVRVVERYPSYTATYEGVVVRTNTEWHEIVMGDEGHESTIFVPPEADAYFDTFLLEDARALRPPNSLRAWDRLEEMLGHEVSYKTMLRYRFKDLYQENYWDTLRREHGTDTFNHMIREDRYRRMGAYEQIARDVDELRQTINRIERQMKEEA